MTVGIDQTRSEPVAEGSEARPARPAQPRESVARMVSKRIAELSGQTTSRAMFYKRAAAEIVRAFNSPFGAISVRFGAEVVEDYWHQGATDPAFWKKPVQDLLTESLESAKPIARRFSSRDAQFHIALISIILRDAHGSMVGVFSLVARCYDEAHMIALRELIEALSMQIALGAARIEAAATTAPAETPGEELAKASSYRTDVELAFALVSSLRNKFACEQVAIGIATGSKPKLLGVSGLDEISDRSNASRLVRDAMGEATDAGRPITIDLTSDGGYRVHRRWHEASGRSPVATVPVRVPSGETVLVSLRRRGDMGFRRDELEQVEALMRPYAPAFTLISRANRSTAVHAAQSLRATTAELVRPAGWIRKVVLAGVIGLGAWIAFGSLNYSVNVGSSVEPAESRHLAAPYAATIASVLVAPGDEVTEGQILATFDAADLRVEREQLLAEMAIAKIEEGRSLADNNSSEAAMARAEQRRASARLAEVDRRIEQATVRAPFDGRVIEGDLRQRIGESLAMGDPLFKLADTSTWTVRVAVPQRVASDLEPGQVGQFAPAARPEAAWDLSIARVKPVPVVEEGKSVYVAEAELHNAPDWLKPGMEGGAQIQFGQRPVWWLLSHRVVDYMRLNFWL
ncbi:MAG: efflux RND transporter periplasmic adaptor subunit [Planctomycetota bacterium]